MHNALFQFKANLTSTKELGTLSIAVQQMTTTAIDVSDIWRAQIVLTVSAFDYFIHELTRIGMIESARGIRPKTQAFKNFQISLLSLEAATSGISEEIWLSNAIKQKHSWLSFQDPDKAADAIRLISDKPLWESVGRELGIPAADIKVRLKTIVDRRNKIAHEADMDPTNPGVRWVISASTAIDTINHIEEVGSAIYECVTL